MRERLEGGPRGALNFVVSDGLLGVVCICTFPKHYLMRLEGGEAWIV